LYANIRYLQATIYLKSLSEWPLIIFYHLIRLNCLHQQLSKLYIILSFRFRLTFLYRLYLLLVILESSAILICLYLIISLITVNFLSLIFAILDESGVVSITTLLLLVYCYIFKSFLTVATLSIFLPLDSVVVHSFSILLVAQSPEYHKSLTSLRCLLF
jgi:hypothetical protein